MSVPSLGLIAIGELVADTPLTDFNIVLTLIGAVILALSLGAGVLHQRVYVVSEPMVAVGVDVVIGPLGFGLLELSQ